MIYEMPVKSAKQRLYGWVACLPCQFPGCPGCPDVQVSHSNQSRDGRGMGMKAYPWRIAAIGAKHHVEIDSGKNLTREERIELWEAAHRSTIGLLFERGHVRPIQSLPIPSFAEEYL